MLKCLLFGHKPDETFEYLRVGVRSVTYCERCGDGITRLVSPGTPLLDGADDAAGERQGFARMVAAEVAPLLPKKRVRKVSQPRAANE